MPSTTVVVGQRPDSASVMKMWKVYMILWKFKRIVKERAAQKKSNEGNKIFNRMLKEAWVEEAPAKAAAGSSSYQQSFTRQLAFGQLEREYKSSSKASDFYNNSLFSLIAKILTVAILLITALLMVFFYETSYNT
uniref:Uncharacterized protein n=1 Tax=Plectus sambesii TaxID=2011161 RepID=A0A914W3S7_9BILA